MELIRQFEDLFHKYLQDKDCVYDASSNVNANYSGTTKKYFNVKVPCLRTLVKEFKNCCFKSANKEVQVEFLDYLFTSNVHEYYIFAAMLLFASKPLLKSLEWDKLFNWLSNAQGWEEVDQYAYATLGEKFLYEFMQATKFLAKISPHLEKLATSSSLELKRAALVMFIKSIRKCNLEQYAFLQQKIEKLLKLGRYLEYKEPIVKKAVAWIELELDKKLRKPYLVLI